MTRVRLSQSPSGACDDDGVPLERERHSELEACSWDSGDGKTVPLQPLVISWLKSKHVFSPSVISRVTLGPVRG